MTFQELCDETKKEFPGFKMVPKSESFLMRAISFFLVVLTLGHQATFMTDFVTTIGWTVYTPTLWGYWGYQTQMETLRHERVHMRQERRYSRPLFFFLYLFFPLPLGLAYLRAKFEWEAYTESLRAIYEYKGSAALLNPLLRARFVGYFTTGQYGWMWPFKKTVEGWYDAAVKNILVG